MPINIQKYIDWHVLVYQTIMEKLPINIENFDKSFTLLVYMAYNSTHTYYITVIHLILKS